MIATHGRGIWIIDDITPLRGLTPEVLSSEAAFVAARPTVQEINAFGGWAEGDNVFNGPNPPDDAQITYYQKKRHIFGDLKIELLDQSGTVLGTVPSSKRRGLNRTGWPMRVKPPRVPSAATAAFGAATGPRLLPGTYTVRMTKDKSVYTTTLNVLPDPRSKYTADERRAQFDLTMKIHGMLGEMTYLVDKINGVRGALEQRAAGADEDLAKRLRNASTEADDVRRKIVATKEGGMITGEERLREFMADLYGNVNNFEGRPSRAQVERTEALGRELADVAKDFDDWAAKELPGINEALAERKLDAVRPLSREEWEKENAGK